MGKTTLTISPDVQQVLRACTFEGFNIYLPAGLSRELYEQVNKVLRLAGAVWDRRQPMGPSGVKGAHVITNAADADKLGFALQNGVITDTKKLHQQFFTPQNVADNLVNDVLHDLEQDGAFQEAAAMNTVWPMRVMDPSCGNGRFLNALHQWFGGGGEVLPPWITIVGVEIDEQHATAARQAGHFVITRDFLTITPKPSSLCDYIFMNPPFSAGQDMRHIMHAFGFLKPGGKLTAIMANNAGEGQSKLHQQFADFCDHWGQELERFPAGTFKESGTMVATKAMLFQHPDF